MLARLDNSVLLAMRTRWHGPRREAAAKGLAFLGEYGWIWLALGVAFALLDPDRRGSGSAPGCSARSRSGSTSR